MHCRACSVLLDADDNYCRRCGAPVRVVALAHTPARGDLVTVGPTAPALLAVAARPIAAGAATIAAGALVRFAVRRAVRLLTHRGTAHHRPADRRQAPPSTEVTEVFWYRRVSRS